MLKVEITKSYNQVLNETEKKYGNEKMAGFGDQQ